MTKKCIALFGGSFNPPHLGHGQVAEFLAQQDQFDEVWLMPCHQHAFDKELIEFDDRRQMCELVIEGEDSQLRVCTIESELADGPSYTFNTIKALKQKYPDNDFVIVVGSDCQNELSGWHRYDELIQMASFFFVPRPGYEDSPFLDISSSQIRQLLRQGKDCTQYLKASVIHYIQSKGLYR